MDNSRHITTAIQASAGLENRDYEITSGGRSVGIVRSRTKATELVIQASDTRMSPRNITGKYAVENCGGACKGWNYNTH
jgi:hypothetical protein